MSVFQIQIPDSVKINDFELKMLIASRLFEEGKLSSGQAAEVVGYLLPGGRLDCSFCKCVVWIVIATLVTGRKSLLHKKDSLTFWSIAS